MRLVSYVAPDDAGTGILSGDQVTLEPGDIIATGTPSGVGVFRDPPIFLVPGDRVRCEMEGICSMENPVIDWSDDVDDIIAGH